MSGGIDDIASRITKLTLAPGLPREVWSELCRIDSDLRAQRAASRERIETVVEGIVHEAFDDEPEPVTMQTIEGFASNIAARVAEQLAGQAVALSEVDLVRLRSVRDLLAKQPVCWDSETALLDRLLSTPGQGARPATHRYDQDRTSGIGHCKVCGSDDASDGNHLAVPQPDPTKRSGRPPLCTCPERGDPDWNGRHEDECPWLAWKRACPAVDPELCRRLASDLRSNKLGGELVQWIDRRYLPGDDETADRLAREIRDEIDGGRCEPLEVFESDESEIARQLTAAAELAERHAALEAEVDRLRSYRFPPSAQFLRQTREGLDAARAECERLRGYLGEKQEECAELRSALDKTQAGRWAQLDAIRSLLATEPAVSEERCAEIAKSRGFMIAGHHHRERSEIAKSLADHIPDLLAAARHLHALRAGLREIVGGSTTSAPARATLDAQQLLDLQRMRADYEHALGRAQQRAAKFPDLQACADGVTEYARWIALLDYLLSVFGGTQT